MADPQRTEKPTKRRLDKAREEGNFPSSREFVTSVQFLGFVTLAALFAGTFLRSLEELMRKLFSLAFSFNFTVTSITAIARQVVAPELIPLLIGGTILTGLTLTAQLATTRLGISATKLTPDFERLNPAKRLASLPSQNLFMAGQAVVMLVLVGFVVYYEISENLDSFLELPWLAPRSSAARIGSGPGGSAVARRGRVPAGWRRGPDLAAPPLHQAAQHDQAGDPRGSQGAGEQPARQGADPAHPARYFAAQDDEGDPHRDRRHRQPNPLRGGDPLFAVDSGAAPKVVAKGKNFLAQRIRQ